MTDNTVAERKRVQVKEALAKLMATENITVEHAPIPTAAFDLINRKLILPLWKDISEEVYTLLISHEVGHALFTPQEDWKKAVIDRKDEEDRRKKNYKNVVNIVEDVRIEKLIQAKHPGTTRSFKAGYAELEKMDLFGTRSTEKQIGDYGILDRINIHYKVGHYGYANVPFADSEKCWLTEIDNAKTFDQVLDISERLLKYAEEEAEQKGEELNPETEGDITIQAGSKEEAEAMAKEMEANGTPGGKNVTIEYPNGDGTTGKIQVRGSRGGPVVQSDTQDSFDKKMRDYVDLNSKVITVNIPKFDLKKVIVDYKKVLQQLKAYYGANDLQLAKAKEHLSTFKNNNKHVVNHLVNQFEMKKKGRADLRAQISKTGMLDTNKLHSYRYNEDIFRKVTSVPTGKSHGLQIFIDMSGSMQTHMAGTYAQMINIAMFCRKLNIPFDVYGFTDNSASKGGSYSGYPNVGSGKSGDVFLDGNFSLRNYLSNRMSLNEYNEMLEYLMCIMSHYQPAKQGGYEYFQCGIPNSEGLGGTPLNETILAAMQIVPEFRATYKLDFVHSVIITDGDGTSGLMVNATDSSGNIQERNTGYSGEEVFCRYRGSSKMWQLTKEEKQNKNTRNSRYCTRDFTANLIDMYKEITSAKMIGFYICDKNSAKWVISNMNYGETPDAIEKLQVQFEDKQFAEIKKNGYDNYYVVPAGKDLMTAGEDLELGDTKSKSIIHKRFLKALSKKKSSRIMLGRFIDNIA